MVPINKLDNRDLRHDVNQLAAYRSNFYLDLGMLLLMLRIKLGKIIKI